MKLFSFRWIIIIIIIINNKHFIIHWSLHIDQIHKIYSYNQTLKGVLKKGVEALPFYLLVHKTVHSYFLHLVEKYILCLHVIRGFLANFSSSFPLMDTVLMTSDPGPILGRFA